ncbi:hypothetical protein CPB85DRAFT_1256563 [Mucidula mucida]|nr:hypothetical protein CPB85DRAFT_1256563 [Mucidula mucida]
MNTDPKFLLFNVGVAKLTQALEEQIAILESRIQQLEDPGNPERGITLTQPYASQVPVGKNSIPSLQILEAHQTQGLPESSSYFSLIQTALRYSSDIGFFLDISRFYGSFYAQDPGVRPLDALVNSILLWGSHLSDASDTNAYESNFLALAVRDAAQGLASGHPQAVMHCIQAEVLLSHYFHRQSRSLEGKYHACVAASLVLSSHLHKIRSADAPSDVTSLSPPLDAVDEGRESMASGRCLGRKSLELATRLSSSWKTNMTAELPRWRCTPKLLFYSSKLLGSYQHIEQNPASRGRLAASMRALEALVLMMDVPNLPVIDSIVGMIWARACQVLIREISSMRAAPPSVRNEPLRILGSMLVVMERMSARYPVINNQLTEIRDARALLVSGS